MNFNFIVFLQHYERMLDDESKETLKEMIEKIENETQVSVPLQYTDDSAMTKSVAKCLLNYNESYQMELAMNFVVEYFQNPSRGYGRKVSKSSQIVN